MNLSNPPFRHATPQQLDKALRAARQHTLALFDCFAHAGLDMAGQASLEQQRDQPLGPPLWQLGRIAWFAEWFVLREAQSSHPADAVYNSLLTRGDDMFDANLVPHARRWSLDLPPPGALKTYCHEVLDRVLDKLSREANIDSALTPYRLALAYEDFAGETLLANLQMLGLAAPAALAEPATLRAAPPSAEIAFPGGTLNMGGAQQGGFVFDNERSAHACHVGAFIVDAAPVSNAQYGDFVADGGYQNRQFW